MVYADADRGELAVLATVGSGNPNAAATLDAHGVDAVIQRNIDQGFFEGRDVLADALHVAQAHDRVADQLPRAVPGELAAAIDIDHGGSVDREVFRLGTASGRV